MRMLDSMLGIHPARFIYLKQSFKDAPLWPLLQLSGTVLQFQAQHSVILVAIAILGNIFCGQCLFLCANEMAIFLQ